MSIGPCTPRVAMFLVGLLLLAGIAGVGSQEVTTLVSEEVDKFKRFSSYNFRRDRKGFRYRDDLFYNTTQSRYARGGRLERQRALFVRLGGANNREISNMSGGFRKRFSLDKEQEVQIMFDIRLVLTGHANPGDDLQAIVMIDDEFGRVTPGQDYITMITGLEHRRRINTGYETFTINFGNLSSGRHTLKFGGFMLKKSHRRAVGRVYFRNLTKKVKDPPTSTLAPSTAPSTTPTLRPSTAPSSAPSQTPSSLPTEFPTFSPTAKPSSSPTTPAGSNYTSPPTSTPPECGLNTEFTCHVDDAFRTPCDAVAPLGTLRCPLTEEASTITLRVSNRICENSNNDQIVASLLCQDAIPPLPTNETVFYACFDLLAQTNDDEEDDGEFLATGNFTLEDSDSIIEISGQHGLAGFIVCAFGSDPENPDAPIQASAIGTSGQSDSIALGDTFGFLEVISCSAGDVEKDCMVPTVHTYQMANEGVVETTIDSINRTRNSDEGSAELIDMLPNRTLQPGSSATVVERDELNLCTMDGRTVLTEVTITGGSSGNGVCASVGDSSFTLSMTSSPTSSPTFKQDLEEIEEPSETDEPAETEVPVGTVEPTGTEVPTGTEEPSGTEVPTGTESPTTEEYDSFTPTTEPGPTSAPTSAPHSKSVKMLMKVIKPTKERMEKAMSEKNGSIKFDEELVPTFSPSSSPTHPPTSSPTYTPTYSDEIVLGIQPSCNANNTEDFNICYDVVAESGYVEAWMSVLSTAAKRWESVIVEDTGFTDPGTYVESIAASDCNGYPEIVDDLYVCVQSAVIDGPLGTFGSARPRVWFSFREPDRVNKTLVTAGTMKLDTADLSLLFDAELLEDVIFKELGHILGIGTLWEEANLLDRSEVYGIDRVRFTRAEEEWHNIGCSGFLPVEANLGNNASDFMHWDEFCLRSEIMTPYSRIDEKRLLSEMTIGSLFDLGYRGANFSQADPYGLNNVNPLCAQCPKAATFRTGPTTDGASGITLEESVSDELLMSIRRYAKGEMETLLASTKDVPDFPATEGKNVKSSADGYIDVLYFAEMEGTPIRSMRVTWNEVKDIV